MSLFEKVFGTYSSKQIKKIKEAMDVVFLTPSAYDEK